jgi:glycosyltransferase involved in cell wall biosynthesis
MTQKATTQKCIVFVVNALTHGGAEIQVSRLARGLRRRGWRVGVVSMIPPEALVPEMQAEGVEVHCLNMSPGVPNPAGILRLRRILTDMRPQVVHSHIAHANILSRVTRMVAGFPVLVCTAHNTHEGGRMLMLAYRYTDWLADLTTNVSAAGVSRQIETGSARPGRVVFVPNGLDLETFRPDPELRQAARRGLGLGDEFTWLAAGRIEEAKDYPNLVRAFAVVAARRPETVLLIAGRGRLEADVKAMASAAGLDGRVRFLGVRSDVPALMNAADAYVMSSRWEGMPLVLQEAAAVGLPVVATDVGGNREVVCDGVSGLLVPPNDAAALAAAMENVLGLAPGRRAEMGRRGRAHVEAQFGIERVLDRWENIYDDLLSKGGGRRCA